MDRSYDVAIVGGGVIGLCTAYYVRKSGASVAVIDKDTFSDGASFVNAGLLVPSHLVPFAAPGVIAQGLKWLADPESPFYIKPRLDMELTRWLWGFQSSCTQENVDRGIPLLRDLALESIRLHDELASLPGFEKIGLVHDGLLMLHNSEKSEKANLYLADLADAAGLDIERFNEAETLAMDPAIRTPMNGSVYFAQDASLDPELFMSAMIGHLRSSGVDLIEREEIVGFDTAQDSIGALKTVTGSIGVGQVVLSTGAWTGIVSRRLGLRIPVQPATGYSITVENPESKLRIPLIITDQKLTITPMLGRIRFGGTLTLVGFDTDIDENRIRPLKRQAKLYCPDLGSNGRSVPSTRSGFRPCTTDGLPIIGRPKNWTNVIVAAGHGMLGMTQAPVTGKIVSDLLSGRNPYIDIRPLSPNRF